MTYVNLSTEIFPGIPNNVQVDDVACLRSNRFSRLYEVP